jgi:glycosyltransferase involved in cell wall biosynthesis
MKAFEPPTAARLRPRTGPVRVCFLIDELSRGGTETQLLELLHNLDRDRIQPHLALMRRTRASRGLEPLDCPVLDLEVDTFVSDFFDLTLGPKVLRLARYLRSRRIDVLHLYFRASTYVGLAAARLARVPKVVRTQNNLGYWMAWYDREKWALLNRWVDRLVVNTREGRDRIARAQRTDPRKIVILENGLDLTRYQRKSLRTTPGPRRIGMVANLRPVKNPEMFVRAAALIARRHTDVTFALAGDGELRPRLESLATDLGLTSRCQFHGSVGDVPGFLAGLDLAVLCSDSEGMSNSVLEYMAAGLPIVATAVGGNPELIGDGREGLLIPPREPARLAEAVGQLLDDSELAKRLGANARQRVERQYSREAMVRRFEEFYRRLRDGGDDDGQGILEIPDAVGGPGVDGALVGSGPVGSRAG